MKLFIAEKPSLARAIAEGIGIEKKEKTHFVCRGDTVVTWCFGHLLEQAEPDAYLSDDIPKSKKGSKIWRMEDLPIFPEKWILQPRSDKGVKAQLSAIGKLIHSADSIINAGDPDREGQLLIDEVLEHFGCKKPVDRFWASAIDSASIQKALGTMKPNKQYVGMHDAALGRAHADWLLGMNLTRLYTLREQAKGNRSLVVVGRVQTPTLTLVAQRDYAVKNFVPIPFLKIVATCVSMNDGKMFRAKWQPKEEQSGLDAEGRLIDLDKGRSLVRHLNNTSFGKVLSCETTRKKQLPPRGFSLAGIQQEASRLYGFSAEDTLNVCQSLYERHKCASYPRTDCEYLPESQHGDAPKVLVAIAKTIPRSEKICATANPSAKSPIWNDKKITAHHAIIPTGQSADCSALSPEEQKIYALIAKRYLAQFLSAFEFDSTQIVLDIDGETFVVTGNIPRVEGWKILYRRQPKGKEEDDGKEEEDTKQILPQLEVGAAVRIQNINGEESQTKPPAYYTEGTLIAAMESIHRAFDDPKIKAQLKEADGIGTPATRAGIISELKRRKFLLVKGKKLHCSEEGREMLKKISPKMRSAVLTAHYEALLKEVEARRLPLAEFEQEVQAFVLREKG